MWASLGPTNTEAPQLKFDFLKHNGTATVQFHQAELGKSSHLLVCGGPEHDEVKCLSDNTIEETIPYFISSEIIAASVIGSILSEEGIATEKVVRNNLAKYFELKGYEPKELSFVWLSRLNTIFCTFWNQSPLMEKTMKFRKERGLEFNIAYEEAKKGYEPPELPECRYSDNKDGRMNIDYEGSCFYTIDHHGIAVCRESPNEYFNLADYDELCATAETIYRDVAGKHDKADPGIYGTYLELFNEPRWTGLNAFPSEDNQTEQGVGVNR